MNLSSYTLKYGLATIAICLATTIAFCQKPKAIYYLKEPGYVLPDISGADNLLLIMPPDSAVDKSLFVVKEYYNNGDLKFIGGTKTTKLQKVAAPVPDIYEPALQGGYISYYHNGHKMEIANYENAIRIGDAMQFYPNGKLYCTKTYTKGKRFTYNECRDSTGNVLFTNGNGKGLTFLDDGFKDYLTGDVINGWPEGEWKGKQGDTLNIVGVFKGGYFKGEAMIDQTGEKIYLTTEVSPEFPGGSGAFLNYLVKHLKVPASIRDNKRGRLIISFIVEKDGTLTDIKTVQGLAHGDDDPAKEALKTSPRWKPAVINGEPVRVKYSVPINFDFSQME